MIIKNVKVYGTNHLFTEGEVAIDGEKFTACGAGEAIDGEGCYAIPGLVDIHTHAAMGKDFCDGDDEAIKTMAEYFAKNGITSFTPASMTLTEEALTKIFENAGNYQSVSGAIFEGINMEGPYLSMAKKGAQNGDWLQKPDAEQFKRLNKLAGGIVRLVSLAPEEPGAMEFIDAVKDEVSVSVAHTTADYDTAMEAFKHGANHVTHLFNAMPSFLHRAPGVIGAALDSGSFVEVISDGVHLHPSVVRAAFKMFGDDKVCLISDSMMACGLDDGDYALGGQPVKVCGNKATLADGTVAGSVTNLMNCMRTAVKFGIPLESAVRAASETPAKSIGKFDTIGSIEAGKQANLVLLDKDLNIKAVYIKGKKIV